MRLLMIGVLVAVMYFLEKSLVMMWIEEWHKKNGGRND